MKKKKKKEESEKQFTYFFISNILKLRDKIHEYFIYSNFNSENSNHFYANTYILFFFFDNIRKVNLFFIKKMTPLNIFLRNIYGILSLETIDINNKNKILS